MTGVGVSEDGIRVKYFDFGNEETVPLDEVYRLPEDVISVPIQVNRKAVSLLSCDYNVISLSLCIGCAVPAP